MFQERLYNAFDYVHRTRTSCLHNYVNHDEVTDTFKRLRTAVERRMELSNNMN